MIPTDFSALRTPTIRIPQYSHIVKLTLHFYAHIGGGSQSLSPPYEQAHVGLDFLARDFVIPTDCSALRTPTIRIPQYSHIVKLTLHFYAHIGGGSQSLSPPYEQAHVGLDFLARDFVIPTDCSALRTPTIRIPQYSHIVKLTLHFYAHIGGGSQSLSPPYEQAHVGLDFLTLVS